MNTCLNSVEDGDGGRLNADTVVLPDRGDNGNRDEEYHYQQLQQEQDRAIADHISHDYDQHRQQAHECDEAGVCEGRGWDQLKTEPMEVEECSGVADSQVPHDVYNDQSAEERRARAYLFSSIESEAQTKVETVGSTSQLTTVTSQHTSDSQAISSPHTETVHTPIPAIPPNTLPSPMDGVQSQGNSLTVSGTEGHLHVHLDNNPAFNTFNYWRTPIMPVELPIPKIEVDIDIMGKTTNVCVKAKVQENDGTYQSQVNLTMATDSANPSVTFVPSTHNKQRTEKEPINTIEAELEALAASLEGVSTRDSSKYDSSAGERQSHKDSESKDVIKVSSPQPQQATYAQVCAASVTSVQLKNEPQPSILASRLTQAQVSMSGGTVTEIKKREMDVVSPSDCSMNMPGGRPSLPSQPSLLAQRIMDPFTVMLPGSSDHMSSAMSEHSTGSTEYINLNQDIVPKTLLEHYISMTDPMRAETVDNELTRHCAYSLPAVALTLGRQNWPVLKDTYETLAGDVHWKVRRTLAFSIHELAVILGEEIAQSDLVPVFNGFIKDLDEVRIGVLKHLAHFLRLLRPQNRRDYLPRMDEFLRTDNENNWRFRLELATQLADIIDLFSPHDCQSFIAPIALALMADKVVHIRHTCYTVMCQLVRQLGSEGDPKYVETLSKQLREKFAQAPTWSHRQSYAFLCGQLVAERSLPLPDWCRLFLHGLLTLASDRVPNVRIAVAKMLNTHIACLEYCQNPENEASQKVQEALEQLRHDKDRDVGHFACCPVNTEFMLDPQDPTL